MDTSISKSGSRTQRGNSDDTRQRFIEATTELLREHGLEAVSTRTICQAVGVKAPTLYHYFGNLAGLHSAVIEQAFSRYYAYWKDRSNVDDPFQRVRDGWDTYISFSIAEPQLFVLVAQQNFARELPREITRAHQELVSDLEAIAKIRPMRYDPELASQIFTAGCIGVASMLAAQRHGIPTSPNLSAIAREAMLACLLM